MQLGDGCELFHLFHRIIAHADRADQALVEEGLHGPGGFFDRDGQVWPMNLIDVDVVRAKSAERILDLLPDAIGRGVSRDRAVVPLESNFGRDENLFPMSSLLNCLSDDFFGNPETVDWRRVDQIDPYVKGGVNRSNRFSLVRASPHPTTDSPRTLGNSRGLHFRAGDYCVFHLLHPFL